MKATVPNLHAARASVAHLSVGQVAIGPISIGQLVVRDAQLGITSGSAELIGVSVRLELRFNLKWEVHVPLPWPFDDINIGDTTFLGSITIPFGFGDGTVPQLNNINLNVPQLVASNTTATADPVTALQADALVAETISASNVTAPVAGVTVSGLGLGSAAVDGLGVPAASIAGATVARVHGTPLSLGALVLHGLALPAAAANDITSGPMDIPLTRPDFTLPTADLGIIRVTLTVTPKATAHIDKLFLTGVNAHANIGAVEVHNLSLPYDALNITLADIGIETIDIPTIGVA